ncbi:MAG: Bug family tripartite tricarboxylate transporter substrate binding protein [Methyloligellaceae bacterium]
MRRMIGVLLTTIIIAGVATAASGAEFPDKPLRFVTPYPPGGSHSLHAGVITTVAEPYFGQPMISVIRAGGGGAVAATQLSKGETDGYRLLFGDPTINSLRPQVEKLPYNADDFVPVARINYAPAIFIAGANAPFDDLKGMIAYAKANPDKLVYSSDNKNGFTYVAFEMLKLRSGAKMRGVDFGGGGPAMAQLLGGNTMAYAGAPSVVGEHILAGKVKPICATDYERWKTLPDVPTCKEAGADIIWHFWRGVLVKKGTPPDRIRKLSDGFSKLVADKGFLRLIKKINSRVDFLGAEEFAKVLTKEQRDLKELYDKIQK